MQYNTTRGLNWEDFAPYELKFTGRSSDSRVSEETATVSVSHGMTVLKNHWK